MPLNVGVGISTALDYARAIKEAITQAKQNLNKDKISFALVFTSMEFAHPAVFSSISAHLGSIPLLGASSLAVICNQGIFKHGVLVALFGSSDGIHTSFAAVKDISSKSALTAGDELGEKLLTGFKGIHRDVATIFSDGMLKGGSDFIWGLQEKLGISFPLVGACASDNLSFSKTYIYYNQESLNDAACGILWGGKLRFAFGAKHGWRPLGKPRYITKSRDNIIDQIDGEPAINIYKEYFAKDITELRKDLKQISVLYPIGIYLPEEEECLLRSLLFIDSSGSLVFQGKIPEKSQIRLMIGTRSSCLSATQKVLEEIKNKLSQPNFLLVFNSVSRYTLLGRDAQRELEILKKGLPAETPIFGLYTYGEQAPLKALNYHGKAYFHNQTITLLGIEG